MNTCTLLPMMGPIKHLKAAHHGPFSETLSNCVRSAFSETPFELRFTDGPMVTRALCAGWVSTTYSFVTDYDLLARQLHP